MSFSSLRLPLALAAASVALGTLAITPVIAQSTDPSVPAGSTVTVVATDYQFGGLPASVPAGTSLGLDNQGAEVHQLIVARKNDGVTESWDELLALPHEEALAKVTVAGELVAAPGEAADGTLTVDQAGEWIALCFVPQGMTAIPSGEPDPSASFGPLHVLLGMRQEFTVTAAMGSPAASAPAVVVELTTTAALKFTDPAGAQVTSIAVTPGQTITFRVTNVAGFGHNFYIGTDAQLLAAQNSDMVGIPDFIEGTQEVTWTVPDDVTELRFGCTVTGHYQLMNGTFTTPG